MEATVLIPVPIEQFETFIIGCVNTCLKNHFKSTGNDNLSNAWLNMDQLRQYHPEKPSRATVYALVSENLIPYHKRSKKLYFLKSEIDEWLKSGRKKTAAEITEEATGKSNRKSVKAA